MTRRRFEEVVGIGPQEAEEVGSGPRESFKYYVCFWSPLVCCGMKTTLIIETVRVPWLEEVGLEEVALRRAGIQEAGRAHPEEVRGGCWDWPPGG